MTIMNGFKLGFGFYLGYSLGRGINESLGRALEKSSFYKTHLMKYNINEAKNQPVDHEAKPKNPVGFGHIYD